MVFLETISVSSGIGKPLHTYIYIYADKEFSETAQKLGDALAERLVEMDYIPSVSEVRACLAPNRNIIYADDADIGSIAHEEWHLALRESGCIKSSNLNLVTIIDESSGDAVGFYTRIKNASDEEKVILEERLSKQFDYARDLIGLYEMVMKDEIRDEETLKSRIKELVSQSPFKIRDANWTRLLKDMVYFGMIMPCYAILISEGIEGLKETVMKAVEIATECDDLNAGCEYIFSRVPEDSGLDIPKTRFGVINEKRDFKISYKSDDFELWVWSSNDDIWRTVSETVSMFREDLPRLRSKAMSIQG